MKIIDLVLILILIAIVGLAIYKIVKDHKTGKCCGCSNGNCECCGGKK